MRRNTLKFRPAPAVAPDWTGTHKVLADIIVEQMGVTLTEVTPDATFLDDLGFDSLDTIEVIMALEEKLNLDIDEEQFAEATTVGAAVTKLDGLLTQKANL